MAISLHHLKNWFNVTILIRIQSFARATRYVLSVFMFVYRFITSRVHPLWIQFFYFLTISLFGSLLLMLLKPTDPDFHPRYIDMFFLSTSALTVSGLATVRMERLSSSQIVVTALLMLVGGEVFVSMLRVFFCTNTATVAQTAVSRVNSVYELETIDSLSTVERIESGTDISVKDSSVSSLKYLGLVIFGYWVFFHVIGLIACLGYLFTISSSRDVLRGKGINLGVFAFHTTVSSFANGGLIATNENMAIFSKNSGLLLFETVLILAGNTLFPLFLRGTIWALSKGFSKNNEEVEFMLKNPRTVKFDHLLTNLGALFRSVTVVGIIFFVLVLFCSLDWRHPVFDGLNSYQKIIAALFMAVNARHAGENSVDCSLISPAVLVFIIFMMYLPSSATLMPFKEEKEPKRVGEKKISKGVETVMRILLLPQVVCVIIFVVAACITERKRLQSDPLNFSALNVIFEVVSAYGNVGLSTGYACSRLQKLHPEISCVDQPYSFSGWWSDEGKLLIVFVMLYGRLKTFSNRNGKAWTLL